MDIPATHANQAVQLLRPPLLRTAGYRCTRRAASRCVGPDGGGTCAEGRRWRLRGHFQPLKSSRQLCGTGRVPAVMGPPASQTSALQPAAGPPEEAQRVLRDRGAEPGAQGDGGLERAPRITRVPMTSHWAHPLFRPLETWHWVLTRHQALGREGHSCSDCDVCCRDPACGPGTELCGHVSLSPLG